MIYLNIFYNPVSERFYLFITGKIWDKFVNETQNESNRIDSRLAELVLVCVMLIFSF